MFLNIRHFMIALIASWVLSVLVFIFLGITLKKALFGFFWFLITPFAAIPAFPISLVVIAILFLLFRRAGSCMRPQWRWIAYMLLILHWEAWGFYCSGYVVV